MTKRLYYTSVIKALYMLQEFEVEFEFEKDGKFYDFITLAIDAKTCDELIIHLMKNCPKKIYVKKESESIFKPKNRDISVVWEGQRPRAYEYQRQSDLYPEGIWLYGGSEYKTDVLTTSCRDGKHFFAPKNES